MGEINNAGDEDKNLDAENGADNQDESQKDGGAAGDQGDDNADDENADDGEGADDDEGSGDKKSDKDDGSKDDKSKSKANPDKDADGEPKTRKRNIDFILERKDRKIEALKNKGGAADQNKDEDNEDDDLADEDAKLIDKRVHKIISPFIEKQMQEEDAQEIADFIAENPDFKPYAAKVAKYAQHPTRKALPIESIFYEVAGKDLMKIGAERGKKADEDAKKSKAGGGSGAGNGDAPKGVWDLTPEEFAAEQEKIRSKGRE